MIDTCARALALACGGDLLIGGKRRPARTGATVPVLDPSTGACIAHVADGTLEDATDAVAAAADALHAWSRTSPRQRGETLRRCFELMVAHADSLAFLISLENGKTLNDARAEVDYAAEFFRWYSEEAVRIIGEISTSPSGKNRILVEHQPIGVCALVTPWNFPAAMATRKLAPALAAGCTTVLKPATLTPLTAYAIASLMEEAGVPAGVVNVVTTTNTGPLVTELLADSRIRKLSFTGSTEVGRVLLRQAADRVLKCSMELGGNAPFIVFDDADLELAVEGAMLAKMRNGGQACTAANRIYVQRSVYKDFSTQLANRMAALRVGPGVEELSECGPLVDLASVRKVAGLVNDAVDLGARILTGGRELERAGFFYAPTVLIDVPRDANLLHTEIFGPVAAITQFDHEEEVIELANSTEYGLAAYVYTRDLARALSVAEELESGMVAINRGLVSDPAAPFGGVKQSGLGREGAHVGLLEFTEPKYVSVGW